MGLLPFSVKAVAEAKVALARLKVVLIHISLGLSKKKKQLYIYITSLPKKTLICKLGPIICSNHALV